MLCWKHQPFNRFRSSKRAYSSDSSCKNLFSSSQHCNFFSKFTYDKPIFSEIKNRSYWDIMRAELQSFSVCLSDLLDIISAQGSLVAFVEYSKAFCIFLIIVPVFPVSGYVVKEALHVYMVSWKEKKKVFFVSQLHLLLNCDSITCLRTISWVILEKCTFVCVCFRFRKAKISDVRVCKFKGFKINIFLN